MVTIDPIVTYTSDSSAVVRWSSDQADPTFYVWVDGRARAPTKLTSGTFSFEREAPPVIDVFDDPAARPRFARGATAVLAFNDVGADAYLIERDSGSGYTLEQYVVPQVFRHLLETGLIVEGGETFRVTPIVDGVPQTPVTAVADPVRVPYPPDVAITIDVDTKQVTVAAA